MKERYLLNHITTNDGLEITKEYNEDTGFHGESCECFFERKREVINLDTKELARAISEDLKRVNFRFTEDRR